MTTAEAYKACSALHFLAPNFAQEETHFSQMHVYCTFLPTDKSVLNQSCEDFLKQPLLRMLAKISLILVIYTKGKI